MSKRDWKPIEEQATATARQLGHRLKGFAHLYRNASAKRSVCHNCRAVCWLHFTPTNGFTATGTALKFGCGPIPEVSYHPPRQ